MDALAIVKAYRGDICENSHHAWAVLVNQTGNVVKKFPESAQPMVMLRSAAKPFQTIPLLRHPQSQTLSLQEWAIICASHSGSAEHLTWVNRVMEKAQITVENLQCGSHPPFDKPMNQQLLCNNTPPTALHNNCSGKHAGMLLACRYYDWPLDTYLEQDHPLQKAILEIIQAESQAPQIHLGIDGCSAPVFAMPLQNAARLFAQLVAKPEYQTLFDAMTHYPQLVGDSERIDTQLMKHTKGNLIAKVGAEGFLAIANKQTQQGLCIKCQDGSNDIRDRLAIRILEDLGWLEKDAIETLRQQSNFSSTRKNALGKTVGHYEFNLPWE